MHMHARMWRRQTHGMAGSDEMRDAVMACGQVAEVAQEACTGGLERAGACSEVAQPLSRGLSRLTSLGTAACRLADAFAEGEETAVAGAGPSHSPCHALPA